MVLPQQPQTAINPAMPGGRDQALAQGLYMAQLAAMKGNCKCDTCRIVRRMSDSMVKNFLASKNAAPAAEDIDLVAALGDTEDGGVGGGNE